MDGAAKTTVMLGVCTSGAANKVDDYTVTVNSVVYSDWFLPSKGELKQMYERRESVGGIAADAYWSSSEGAADLAWVQGFGGGGQDVTSKGDSLYVRPVRAF